MVESRDETTIATTTRTEVAWLARRAAWGLRPGQLDELEALGTDAVIDLLVDPAGRGVAVERSAWADVAYVDEDGARREQGLDALNSWVQHLVRTGRPFENAMAWFWHDHFAVSYAVVTHLPLLLDHLDLLRRSAFGDFRTLIREVTTDGAMLAFLDGTTSTGASPNENYGRELLELYTLGIGNYTEDDVRAAAVALTGWVVAPPARLRRPIRRATSRSDPAGLPRRVRRQRGRRRRRHGLRPSRGARLPRREGRVPLPRRGRSRRGRLAGGGVRGERHADLGAVPGHARGRARRRLDAPGDPTGAVDGRGDEGHRGPAPGPGRARAAPADGPGPRQCAQRRRLPGHRGLAGLVGHRRAFTAANLIAAATPDDAPPSWPRRRAATTDSPTHVGGRDDGGRGGQRDAAAEPFQRRGDGDLVDRGPGGEHPHGLARSLARRDPRG